MKKKILALIILFISFFIFVDNTKAINVRGIFNEPSGYGGITYHLKGVSGARYINGIGIFVVGNEHVYCIEPGIRMNYIGYENNNNTIKLSDTTYVDSKFLKNDSAKRTLVAYILTFAHKSSNPTSMKDGEYQKIIAAQALIWEVVTGERTNFTTLKPNNSTLTDSMYNVIHNSSNSNMLKVKTEYDRIVSAIQNTYLKNPGKFNSDTKAKSQMQQMVWDNSLNAYKLTVRDSSFSYWKLNNAGGLDVKLNKNSVVITSKEAISASAAKRVVLGINSSKTTGTATIYIGGNYQDVTTIDGIDSYRYLYVYTPLYQLKVKKKASLDGKLLSGVKFNVCSDQKCSKVLGTITTNKNGEAIFDKITIPGEYYLKETSTIKGYVQNKALTKVVVKSNAIAGSSTYAEVTVTNNNNVFNLEKYTEDENKKLVLLNDGCNTGTYTGPEFEIKENGKTLYFKELSPGNYEISSNADGSVSKLKTCNGRFKVYTLANCNYEIVETKAPEGLTLPANPSKKINVCGSDRSVSFTNGFTGVEFQKKDENGNFISGGKFTLQLKEKNIYKDVLLNKTGDGYYEYVSEGTNGSYIFETSTEQKGKTYIKGLKPGEYRIIEKEAPEGYDLIADKDSTATFVISDSNKEDYYYLVELINQKSNKSGSSSSAKLVLAIITGRSVPNYALIIGGLLIVLVVAIILRKKMKK